jgi:hypothetical protein
MAAHPTTQLDPGDSRSVEKHEEYAIMSIVMFGNVHGEIPPTAKNRHDRDMSPASPHRQGRMVAPPDARFLPHAGEAWINAWKRARRNGIQTPPGV